VLASLALLLVRRREWDDRLLAGTTAALVMLISYVAVILRHPVVGRVPDMASVVPIMAACCLGDVWRAAMHDVRIKPVRALTASAAAVTLVGAAAAGTWVLGRVGDQIVDTGIMGGVSHIGQTYADTRRAGTEWPWEQFWPAGPVPAAVGYVVECTRASDTLLVTWRAPHYYFFTDRRFGAGHAVFLAPRAYTTARDQQLMVSRLERQSIPIVLINENQREEFARSYPRVDEYLQAHYERAGEFTTYEGEEIAIAVRRGLTHTRSYGPDAWPCGFEPDAGRDQAAKRVRAS
jgi:hypothetical protein